MHVELEGAPLMADQTRTRGPWASRAEGGCRGCCRGQWRGPPQLPAQGSPPHHQLSWYSVKESREARNEQEHSNTSEISLVW